MKCIAESARVIIFSDIQTSCIGQLNAGSEEQRAIIIYFAVYFSEAETYAVMSAQGDCEFLVKRARELVSEDPWAAKAWLITARTLYPADFNIQVAYYILLYPVSETTRTEMK